MIKKIFLILLFINNLFSLEIISINHSKENSLDLNKTSEILNAPKAIVFVIPFVEKVNEKQIAKLNTLGKEAKAKGFIVTAVSNNPIKGLELENCFMDQTTMKTIIRSNPGVMILEKGTVKAKYHDNDFPSLNQLEQLF